MAFIESFLVDGVVFVNANFQQFANQPRRGFDGFNLGPKFGVGFHQAPKVVPGGAFSLGEALKDKWQAQVQKTGVFDVRSQLAVFTVEWIDWMVCPEIRDVVGD